MEPPAAVTLYPEDLLHKFGFDDGDVMFFFMQDHGLGTGLDHHHLLIAVVERLLVPRLDQDVETMTIWATLHNPIRARTIDGEEATIHCTITPESVDIPAEAILEIHASLTRPGDGDRPAD
ncbi:MAG: hypothetical protein KQH83_11765 [Actinobacteria bacterium]|nr:hypothetical protein [Actinomycetota bacterium]